MGRQKNVTASSGLYDVKVSISYSNSCTLHSGYFTGCVMASVDGSDGYIMENYLAIAVDYTVVMMVSDCRCLEFSYFCFLVRFFFPFVFIIAYFVSSFVFLGRASSLHSVAHILSPEKKISHKLSLPFSHCNLSLSFAYASMPFYLPLQGLLSNVVNVLAKVTSPVCLRS